MGRPARRALAGGRDWRVLAVFHRSFYCRDTAGLLICLGPPALGAGPLNVLAALPARLDWPSTGLEPGAPVEVSATSVRVDGRFVFRLAGAQVWRPAPSPGDRSPAAFARGVAILAAIAAERVPADGFGRLIPALATAALAPSARRDLGPLLDWLEAALVTGAPIAAPPVEAAALLGLGPGLTPAGDDLVAGILLALHDLGRGDVARPLAEFMLEEAGSRTGTISRAHLACAAAGEGAAAVHAALAAVWSADPSSMAAALDAAAAIGHTSGWDALAGIAAVAGVCQRTGG
jgi:hypothetical protein